MKSRPGHQLISTIALLAVLFNALAPAVSQAMSPAAAAGRAWTEACTAQGARWLLLDEGGRVLAVSAQRPDDTPPSLHGAACGYCLVHAASFGLPPPAVVPRGLLALPPEAVPAEAVLAAPRARPVWAAPAARAPPGP